MIRLAEIIVRGESTAGAFMGKLELGEGLQADFETGRPPGMPAGQDQRLVMSIGTQATFSAPGPHAAVVQINGEEIGRARFYLMEGGPDEDVGLA